MSTTVEHRINILSGQIDRLAGLCQAYEGDSRVAAWFAQIQRAESIRDAHRRTLGRNSHARLTPDEVADEEMRIRVEVCRWWHYVDTVGTAVAVARAAQARLGQALVDAYIAAAERARSANRHDDDALLAEYIGDEIRHYNEQLAAA